MSKPNVTKTNHVLPYGELSPAQFERLCLWLVEYEKWQDAEHYGEAGNEQGRDVIAYRATTSGEPQLWYFQCKRYKDIGAAELKKEITKIAAHIAAGEIVAPRGIVFVTNAVVSATTRKEVKEACHAHNLACRFWARTELDLKVKKHEAIVKEFFNLNLQSQISNSPPAIKLTLPPPLTPHLFGRDDELRLLDAAWASPTTNLVVFHALGGAGKSALVSKWLAQMAAKNYDGARRVFGWSFFSQGSSENRSDSSEAFIDSALAFFGVTVEGDYFRKADRLAEALRAERTILILDGVEPLQYPPNSAGLPEGGLKDRALQTILTQLAAQQPGLCVIMSRERLSDLNGYDEATVIQRALDHLPYATATGEQPCAQLLRALGATGDDDEVLAAAREFQGHAYGLTLLGSYVAEVLGGDLRRRKDIANLFDDDRFGSQADRMIAAYEKWLGDGVEVAILRLLGLFDRPAEAASIAALREAPAIAGLTETLQGLSEVKWQQALSRLRRIYLLGSANWSGELDAHPLVREHFRQQLKTHVPDAWQAGNLRLYEHLTRTAKDFPDTLAEMQPLFAAVKHGCAASKHQEVFDEIYRKRIHRNGELFNLKKFGAYDADLIALSSFFDLPWQQPIAALTKTTRGFILNQAGFDLQAIGRLVEAILPTQAAVDIAISQAEKGWEHAWEHASSGAGNISQLCLTLGNLSSAVAFAQQSVDLACRSENESGQISAYATHAIALHQMGRLQEASTIFREAEDMQQQMQPEYQYLYSLSGYHYCDLLLSQRQAEDVLERASLILEEGEDEDSVLALALYKLVLGQAHLQLARQAVGTSHNSTATYLVQAADWLQHAVEELQQAGRQDERPRGLLARAAWARVAQQFDQAHRDLAEARAIAERGEMRLHLCDYHLESARLHLAQGHLNEAHTHWETARHMINEMGYHRRDAEVAELEAQLTALG